MRHRLEDLGRLTVLIQNLLDYELLSSHSNLRPSRAKDWDAWLTSKTEEQKDDIFHSWAYGMESIRERLYEMLEIAEGADRLNERVNE